MSQKSIQSMSRRERYQKLKGIQAEHQNFVYKPLAQLLLKVAAPFIRNFKTSVSFEDSPPTDGGVIFVFNHQNYYDSLVAGYALDKKYGFTCLAGDEPRGTIQGLSLEARGVVWINRSDANSRKAATETLLALLRAGLYVGWSPEGTWNTTENRLMLPLAYGMAQTAIEASKTSKVYLVPVCMDYHYKENQSKVKCAAVRVCKAIPVSPDMKPRELTDTVETVCWTTRWEQMEARMRQTPACIPKGDSYFYPREKVSRSQWEQFVNDLHNQYKVDWSVEESYRIITPEEKLQREMQKYIRPFGATEVL